MWSQNVSTHGLLTRPLQSKLLLLLIWVQSATCLSLSASFHESPQHRANRHCPRFFVSPVKLSAQNEAKTNVSVLTLFSVKLQLAVLMPQHTFLVYVVIIQSRCYRFYPILLTLRCSALAWRETSVASLLHFSLSAGFSHFRWCVCICVCVCMQDADEEVLYKVLHILVDTWIILMITWSLSLIIFKMHAVYSVKVWLSGLEWCITLLTFFRLLFGLNIPVQCSLSRV